MVPGGYSIIGIFLLAKSKHRSLIIKVQLAAGGSGEELVRSLRKDSSTSEKENLWFSLTLAPFSWKVSSLDMAFLQGKEIHAEVYCKPSRKANNSNCGS